MPRASGLGFTNVVNIASTRAPAPLSIASYPAPVVVPAPRATLVAWNGAMFAFHALLATVTLALGNHTLNVPVFKTRLDFRYTDPFSGMVESKRTWEIVPLYEEAGSLPFTWLVALFFLLSSGFHLANITLWKEYYFYNLDRCYSPTRWLEYTLSAPVMILLISYTLGVRNREVLLANFVLVLITMPFGYWVEVVSRPVSKDEWNKPLVRRLYPWMLGHIPQATAWLLIITTFYDGQDQTDRAPWFVHIILWVEFALFFSFGAASVLSQAQTPKTFYRGELLFQLLSLVSKGLLGMLLIVNVLMLSRFDDLYD